MSKLVRITLETSNLVFKYTSTHTYGKYTFQCQGPLNLANVSICYLKKSAFFDKNGTFTQSNSARAALEIFQLTFSFCKIKGYFYRKCFAERVSGIRLSDCSKLVINQNNDDDVTICRHVVIVKFFDVILSLLSTLVTGPKSRFLSFAQYLEIPGRDTRFDTNISNKLLLNAVKCQGYSFNYF